MNCMSCGKSLPAGVAFCSYCGAPIAPDMPGQGSSSPYDPTEASGSSQNYPPLPPTVAANPDNYPPQQPSYTNYGASIPAQLPYPPYNTPADYPGTPPPPAPANYGPYYKAPAMPVYAPGMPSSNYATPSKKSHKVGWIIGISLLALLFLCGGLIAVVAFLGKSATTTSKSSINITTTTDTIPTSGNAIPSAARILFGVQTSSAIDTAYYPTQVTTTFATGKNVNLTFHIDSAGKDGYIKVKWYENGQQVDSNMLPHHAKNDHGYFGESFTDAGSGTAALYWCTKADCSDEQLAQVVSFTITGTGTIPSHNTIVATSRWHRPGD